MSIQLWRRIYGIYGTEPERGHLVSHNPIRWDTGLLWVAIKAEELHT